MAMSKAEKQKAYRERKKVTHDGNAPGAESVTDGALPEEKALPTGALPLPESVTKPAERVTEGALPTAADVGFREAWVVTDKETGTPEVVVGPAAAPHTGSFAVRAPINAKGLIGCYDGKRRVLSAQPGTAAASAPATSIKACRCLTAARIFHMSSKASVGLQDGDRSGPGRKTTSHFPEVED